MLSHRSNPTLTLLCLIVRPDIIVCGLLTKSITDSDGRQGTLAAGVVGAMPCSPRGLLRDRRE